MATIRTSIQINDMMSQQFRAMNLAMATVIDSFQTLQDTSSNAIDVSALETAHRELQQVEATFNSIEHELTQAEQAQNRMNNEIREGSSAAEGLWRKLKGIAATYLGLQATQSVINLSDKMANIDARLNLIVDSMPAIDDVNVNLHLIANTEGLSQVEHLQQQIFDASQRAYAPYAEMANLVGKLGLNARDAFDNTNEIVAFSELVQKQFAIAGTGANEAANATLQLTQALASGVLRGDELGSIFEQAPNLIQNIADYLEVPIGEIRQMASEGQITAEIVKASMFAAADEINAKFEIMPLTFGQIWTSFQNHAYKAFEPVLKQLNDIANSERFQGFVNNATQALYIVAAVVLDLFNIISNIGAFIYDNWSYAEPAIVAATAALIAYGTAQLWVNRETIISAALTATETIRKWAYVAATIAQSAATYGLVGAMSALGIAIAANPIAWLVGAIIALVLLFYAAVAAVNHFAGTSYSATGLIAGAFATAGAFIANVFAGLFQLILGIIEFQYNQWAAFANFFGNVFNDPVGSIIHLFGDLADNVLGVIEKIASAIDFVFGSNLASAVSGWRSELSGLVDWAAAEYGNGQYEVLYEKLDMNQVMSELGFNLDRFEYSNAWDSGYDWGANLFKFDGLENQMSDQNSLMAEIYDAINAGNLAGMDTAGNTKKMADSIDISGEDLKYLRDLAEQEVVNQFTTAEIKIEMTNHNNVNSDMDLDGIADYLTEKVEEAMYVSAEGVHV